MRAGRLLSLLLTLQNGGRYTAGELAERLGVSQRTVLRDIEVLSGSGVPVYATRGPQGGFELLDTFEQAVPALPPGLSAGTGPLRRVRVRIAPAALQMARGYRVILRRFVSGRSRPATAREMERAKGMGLRGNARWMANLLFTDIFERHPGLRLVSVEPGVGWMPFFLESLDYQAGETAPGHLKRLPLKPSSPTPPACIPRVGPAPWIT